MAPSRSRVRSATIAVLTALGTLAATAVVVAGGGAAHAAEVGTLTLTPTTGTDTSTVSFTTHSTSGTGCPAPTTNISAKAFGPGGWSGGIFVLGNTTSDVSTSADFTVAMSDTFNGISQSNGVPIVAGKYDIVLSCRDRLATNIYGTMTGSIWFTTPTSYQSTDPNPTSSPTPTTPTPTPTTPTPTPTPPAPPAPSKPSLTAAAGVSGTARVGSTLTCTGGFSGASAMGYQWFRSGVATTGATGVTWRLAAADYAKQVGCRITAVNAAGSSTSSSGTVLVALGPALRNTVKPVITGKTVVGKVLRVSHGSWAPVASSYTYQWKRDGKTIKGATTATHKVVKADRHHKLTVKVTAVKAGYAKGSVLSKVRSIP